MDFVEIGGKKYRLVPVEEEPEDLLADYVEQGPEEIDSIISTDEEPSVVKRAEPSVFEYRERFKRHQVRAADIIARPKRTERRFRDPFEDEFRGISGNAGYDAFYGPGLEEDI